MFHMEIGRRNINNLRYADDTALLEESSNVLKHVFVKVKTESAKTGMLLNIKIIKIMTTEQPHYFKTDSKEG